MGRTFKDQHKWEKKQRVREHDEELLREKKQAKKHRYTEIIPDEDELDPYELIDYRDYQ